MSVTAESTVWPHFPVALLPGVRDEPGRVPVSFPPPGPTCAPQNWARGGWQGKQSWVGDVRDRDEVLSSAPDVMQRP